MTWAPMWPYIAVQNEFVVFVIALKFLLLLNEHVVVRWKAEDRCEKIYWSWKNEHQENCLTGYQNEEHMMARKLKNARWSI